MRYNIFIESEKNNIDISRYNILFKNKLIITYFNDLSILERFFISRIKPVVKEHQKEIKEFFNKSKNELFYLKTKDFKLTIVKI